MMKLLLIVFLEMFLFYGSPIHKCSSIDTMKQMDRVETDDSLLLNETEAAYLNKIFETTRKNFDFTNKKVGFIKISGEKGKIHYFDMQKRHYIDKDSACDNGTLYIFDADQKEESGGYDAAIVYWSKFLIPIKDVVKRLKGKGK